MPETSETQKKQKIEVWFSWMGAGQKKTRLIAKIRTQTRDTAPRPRTSPEPGEPSMPRSFGSAVS